MGESRSLNRGHRGGMDSGGYRRGGGVRDHRMGATKEGWRVGVVEWGMGDTKGRHRREVEEGGR